MGKIITCKNCKEEKQHKAKNMCNACYVKNYRKTNNPYKNLTLKEKRVGSTYRHWLDAWRDKQIPYDFHLTRVELKQIIENHLVLWTKCNICKCETTLHSDIKGRKYVRTLDRIDNNKGHVCGNLQVLCMKCNARKDNHDYKNK